MNYKHIGSRQNWALLSQKWKKLDFMYYKYLGYRQNWAHLSQKWKELDSMYYKRIVQTELGIFVTEMEGSRFHLLKGNFTDRIGHIFHRNGRN